MTRRLAYLWLAIAAAAAVLAPAFLTASSQLMRATGLLEAPSAAHWFGTDELGRDVFSRVLCGAQVSLGVALAAVAIATSAGIVIGAAAGYFGGRAEKLLMAAADIMLCFPTFFLILAVIAVLGPSVANILVVIGLTGWMGTARLVRAEVLSLKQREFVLASRALGAGHLRILFRHLIPNALGPAIVNAVLGLSSAILAETGLSFLGIGVQPPVPSWGNILMEGKAALGVAWWLTVFPGVAIFLTVLSANVFAEQLHARTDT